MTMRTPQLRQVPGDSLVHRLWAGTKLLVVLLLGLITWVLPSWPALGLVAALLIITALIAGIPLGAIPRPPWWFWGLVVLGGVISAFGNGVDGIIVYARATLLGLVLLGMSILVIWTTAMSEIAPAIAKLMRPLRWLKLPVDDWAVSIALCLRGLPMLIDELRMLWAAHKQRPKDGTAGHPAAEMSITDILVASMSSALRRSSEMAEAITARGGTGMLTAYPAGPKGRDWVVMAVVVIACGGAVVGTILL